MSLIGAAAISAAGNLLGGLLGASGQRDTNRMNERIARENRAFQERMSSTAAQRAAQDFEAAGLNRILALGSPASTPSGAVATMQNPQAHLQKGIEQATNSARAAALARKQVDQMDANIKNTQADEDLKRANEDLVAEDIQLKRQQRQESLSRYVVNMTSARANTINAGLTAQAIPGAKAGADIWRFLDSNNMDGLAKFLGVSIPVATKVAMAARMLKAGGSAPVPGFSYSLSQ